MKLLKIFTCPVAIVVELLLVFLLPAIILLIALFRKLFATQRLEDVMESVARFWARANYYILRYLLFLKVDVIGADAVVPGKNYFVIANHQSWIDILMLEEALLNKSGFSRYFIKKNLMHVPLAGWVCKVLHYPYMYRFAKSHLAKHPEDKGKDVEITKRSCEKLKNIYFKLNNFPEGTRFTQAKHDGQNSPYRHLLKPKSGGIANAFAILHDRFECILDLTIVYAEPPNIVKLFLGQMTKVTIIIEKVPLTMDLVGDYAEDQQFRIHFQKFITNLWEKKDQKISQLTLNNFTNAS